MSGAVRRVAAAPNSSAATAVALTDAISPRNYALSRLFPRRLLAAQEARERRKGALGDLAWEGASSVAGAAVGVSARAFMALNRVRVHNGEVLEEALDRCRWNRRSPLVTVSNHHCCLDDPFLFGAALHWRHLLDKELMRWSLAAHDVCFTRASLGSLFSLGKIVPVVRGLGVRQPGVDFALRRLREGGWVHVFPEGRVNLTKEQVRLKWGVGRLVADCPLPLTVLPIFHLGLDSVLPNRAPYLPRIGRKVTVCVGEPMVNLQGLAAGGGSEKEREGRKAVTDAIQDKMRVLESRADALHTQHCISS